MVHKDRSHRPASHPRCSGPMQRRSFLEVVGLSVLGMGMADYLRAEEIAKLSEKTCYDAGIDAAVTASEGGRVPQEYAKCKKSCLRVQERELQRQRDRDLAFDSQ